MVGITRRFGTFKASTRAKPGIFNIIANIPIGVVVP